MAQNDSLQGLTVYQAARNEMATPRPRRISWPGRFLLVFLSLLFVCLTLEAGLRIKKDQNRRRMQVQEGTAGVFPGTWPVYDPDLGYRPRPNTGEWNADGLRDHPIGPKEGHFRILFLGDSIAAFGDNVDDTFVGYLRTDLLKERSSRPLDIINGGITGYTDYQEIAFLKKFGLRFQPDLVGVEFCLNDLHKIAQLFEYENGRMVGAAYFSSDAKPRSVTEPSWPKRLARKSELVQWLRDNVPLLWAEARLQATAGYTFDHNPDVKPAWEDTPWTDIEGQLQELVTLGRENHFSVFLVVFPIVQQYKHDYLARSRDYVLKPQRKLREICARLGIPFLDLYADLDASAFSDGLHLTKAGRQRVGHLIAGFLSTSNLLPLAR